jgi:hypothetical protein
VNENDIRDEVSRMIFSSGSFDVLVQEFLDSLTSDYSDFHYVDGEEGDYGIIRYTAFGQLIATKTVHGGDMEDIDFTDQGKLLLSGIVKQSMESKQ